MPPRPLLLALAAVLAGCASAPAGDRFAQRVTVEAEGWAPASSGNDEGARQRALALAQKNAVEKGAGLFVVASTLVDAAVATRQRIISRAGGRIESFTVLWDRLEGGFRKVRIRALIVRPKPEASGDDTPHLRQAPPDSPAVRVDIRASNGSAADDAAAEIGARLSQIGLRVDRSTAAVPALLVRGTVRTYPVQDDRLGRLRSYRAGVRLEIIDQAAGRLVAVRSPEAAAVDENPEEASARAVDAAGRLAGDEVAEALGGYLWERDP